MRSLKKAARETLLAIELNGLDAWLLDGERAETCDIEPARGSARLASMRIWATLQ
ncbi:MAG: hypothetical protein HY017_09510 [Betaproteobacteria bacterium]|nr:hypothetical protein [Betaproteobacteria bacterium]